MAFVEYGRLPGTNLAAEEGSSVQCFERASRGFAEIDRHSLAGLRLSAKSADRR